MSTITELLKTAVKILKDKSETPILDVQLIFIHAMNKCGYEMNKIKIITCGGNQVPNEAEDYFFEQINKRKMGTPVQYITKVQEFMGLEFYIEEGILIPRADTEIIVERIINLCKEKTNVNILDMCTGSGAIAVSLADYIPNSQLVAVDLSSKAIECCNINIKRHKLSDRVYTVKSDLFEAINDNRYLRGFDVIVSNPPYIPSEDIKGLSISVKDYEPMLALDGGEDGLYFYRRIISESVKFLKHEGILCFEIGHNQGDAVSGLMNDSGYYKDIFVEKDLAGLDRCVYGILNMQ